MNVIGTTLGGFQIIEELGRGGMSVVYRAYQPGLERWVAVKILEFGLSDATFPLRRFRREARSIAALQHPNILTVFAYGEERGVAYIAMEYVPGGSLEKRMGERAGRPFDWSTAAALIIPIGKALAFAHSQEIIHRDVKPANVLLGRDDWPLLADFGLVKVSRPRRKITVPGVGMGTPFYTAPEQILGATVDRRADIYALGMTLYEMLSGQKPFAGDTPGEILVKRLSEAPIPPRQFNPNILASIETILLRALAREPDERYSTMDELVAALELEANLRGAESSPGWGGCPACGATINLSKPFCRKCGASILAVSTSLAARRTPSPAEPVATTRLSQSEQVLQGPRLMMPSTGVTLPLLRPGFAKHPERSERTVQVPSQPAAPVLIGRGDPSSSTPPDVDLAPHGGGRGGVSRIHARLVRRGQEWFIEDLNSTNGTFVNGQPLTPEQPVRLRDGDAVRLGQMTLIFYQS